jgi:hypothetical protein
MLLVLIEAIPPLTFGGQGHPVNEQPFHRTIIFHERYLTLTDIAEFSHIAPSLSKDALMRLIIIIGDFDY